MNEKLYLLKNFVELHPQSSFYSTNSECVVLYRFYTSISLLLCKWNCVGYIEHKIFFPTSVHIFAIIRPYIQKPVCIQKMCIVCTYIQIKLNLTQRNQHWLMHFGFSLPWNFELARLYWNSRFTFLNFVYHINNKRKKKIIIINCSIYLMLF